jgi:16S rRNA G966 N2-methylase RsmD
LDELKLYSTKQYVGDLVLAGMIEKLRQEGSLEGKLTFARPGSSRLDKRLEGKVDPNRTFWLILDRSIGRFDERHPPSLADSRHPGNRHTLICYDQTLLNQNPFHIFDENKPGWYDHTTIPHTLMGAMINLTRPYWSTGRVQRLCDPFAGSGTAWLESRKYVDVTFSGFDTEHLSQNVSNDNLVFFSQSLTCLQQIQASIKKAYENVVTPPHELDEVEEWNTSPEHAALDWANNLIDQIVKRSRHDEFVFDEGTVTELRRDDVTLLARLFFYTTLKGRRRFSAALGTGQISEKDVLAKELDRLNKQIKRYVGVRERLATKSVRTEGPRALFLEQYSSAISLNPEWLASSIGETPIAIRSITKMTEESAYDVIVTDPPYGFNTHEHVESLVEVYREGLANIIRALTSDGQLVIALPDWSHTGRRIPAFAFKEFVTYNLLQMARQQGREAYQASAHHPGFSVSTLPPYYWESERALRRAILHFRFRPLNNT